ncbi:FxsA family protein [Kribbella sindirgiensis]|uniref:FxsA family protein n=1 Tax=Kribbella sindirgiensis TaxID=1124744 RepID=A0A4R0I3Z7_9ACTN|nr:FxsA family protein [Kribbella sindirgiensis]TCC17952.1 FxsA family protein [Kribbella sindirgiensis]
MPWFVALALLVVPIAEIFVIIQVGQVIGGWPTVGLLLVESALGAWLIKREGRRAWRALQSSFETGKMPGRELADAALVLVGGTLLLTPGFLTDIFGFFFVLPFTRPLARRAMTAFFGRRVATQLGTPGFTTFIPGPTTPGPHRPTDDVIQGEVIDPDKK